MDGFVLSESFNNTLIENSAKKNGEDGFRVDMSAGNVFKENTGDKNGNIGFNVLATSELNTFLENSGCGNGVLDAFDESLEASGNDWVNNEFCNSAGIRGSGSSDDDDDDGDDDGDDDDGDDDDD